MSNVFVSIKDIDTSEVKWIDARFSLADANEGKRFYKESHVSGAMHWDLNDDLSDLTKRDGRQPMPSKESLVELFRRSGLNIEDTILVYDDGGSPFATRAWWFLQYAGFENASVVVEGFEEIKESSVPVDNETPIPKKTAVNPNWNESIYASREFVEETVAGRTSNLLVDARAANRYRGEIEPLDRVAGHIPGAFNFDWEQLKSDGKFQFDQSIKEKLSDLADSNQKVTVYCGSGVTASPLYAMLSHYGYENIRLYVGSYSDWVSKEDAQVEKG
ncbi:sulfurtransferase [Sporosarcina sp. Marseille-Q4063]|uniref:sulfurtransferase n=1 Tax=Sporosarcina sp. Marseille-Q4063 TaxID=2810514 RepID=UPI001BAE901F|nr:sulfurtransferase [Sporosarcina sp. Marseille-Q4063]QUW22151.1 sulfurtransferase [Sporosarcina sp. Marseille-Q4063]